MKTNTKNNNFENLKRKYALSVLYGTPEQQGRILQDLARAVVFSVLKHRIKATADPYIIKTKNDFISEIHRLNAIDNITDTNLEVSIDNKGNYVMEVVDKSLDADLARIMKGYSDTGADLQQEAALALWEAGVQAKKRPSTKHLRSGWIDEPIKTKEPRKEIYTDSEIFKDNFKDFKIVELSPIRRVFRKVGGYLDKNRNKQALTSGYSYLEYRIKNLNEEEGIDYIIYRRFGKYADIGGYTTAENGKPFYTVDQNTAENMEEIIAGLRLTPRQGTVLDMLLSGRGYRDISAALRCSWKNIYTIRAAIQKKYIKYREDNPNFRDPDAACAYSYIIK